MGSAAAIRTHDPCVRREQSKLHIDFNPSLSLSSSLPSQSPPHKLSLSPLILSLSTSHLSLTLPLYLPSLPLSLPLYHSPSLPLILSLPLSLSPLVLSLPLSLSPLVLSHFPPPSHPSLPPPSFSCLSPVSLSLPPHQDQKHTLSGGDGLAGVERPHGRERDTSAIAAARRREGEIPALHAPPCCRGRPEISRGMDVNQPPSGEVHVCARA